MKKIYFFITVIVPFFAGAQVGINTTTPNAQLEVKSSNQAAPANTDGLLIPKVNAFPVLNPTVAQQGMLVYLTTTVGSNSPGFYYWDNPTTTWINIKGADGGTLDQAYDFGGAGNGNTITADAGAVLINGTDGLVSTGTIGSGALAPSGAGTRMVWNPRKSAFRAGEVSGNQWDDASIAQFSTAFGSNSIASGSNSFAGASGSASGNFSLAFGSGATASGQSSIAIGFSATASSQDAVSIGFGTTASAPKATAFGTGTTSSGFASTSFGAGTTASGQSAAAFGSSSIASGTSSFASGQSARASGTASAAFGASSTASGGSSFSSGLSVTASGQFSSAFGESSQASGIASYTFGRNNISSGEHSTTFGRFNNSPSYGEVVIGIGATTYTPTTNGDTQFRTANATDRLFVIGNAIDANNSSTVDVAERSDAMVVLKNGNIGIGNSTPQDKLHVVGNIRMVDGNQAAGKVLTSDANGTATWQNASANAWGVLGNSGTNPTTNFIGTTDNVDLVFKTNNVDKFRIKSDGRIEAGNNGIIHTYSNSAGINPKLILASENLDNNIYFQATNNTSDGPSLYFSKSRGVNSSPTIVSSGDNISRIFFHGYNGSQFVSAAQISSSIDGIPSLTSMPGMLQFSTTKSGSITTVPRMTINNSGLIGIGTTSPQDILHVVGKIRMVDGSQATGKVMTSNANGTATWQDVSANAWGLIGNSATDPTTNFIGTSDDVDVIFKRNDIRSGLFGTTNSSFGLNALNIASTGSNNTAIGVEALKINTTGSNNTAIGQNALATINQGSNNTGIGVDTATTSTLLTNATAIGYKATVGGSNSLVLGSINGVNAATSSVNVGIGTVSPQTALEVVDTNTVTSATVEGTVNVMTNGPQTIDSGGSITLGGTFTDAGNTFRTFGSIEGRKANATTNSSSGYLILKTNNGGTLTERMRITNAGAVGIGTPTPGGQFELSLNEGRKPTSNTWTIPSDARLKNVKGVYEKGLAEILQLKPIRYNYKNTDKKTFEQKVLDKEAYGFLAQEVQPLFPEAVGTDADGYLNFDLHPILIASVNAFKELNTKYEALKIKNQELEEKINQLMERMNFLETKN